MDAYLWDSFEYTYTYIFADRYINIYTANACVEELREIFERVIGSLAFLLDADGETVFLILPRFVFTALSLISFSEDVGDRLTLEMESNLKMFV